MRKIFSAAVLATGLLVSSGAWAKTPMTVQDYMTACAKSNSLEMFCAGVVSGIQSVMSLNSQFVGEDDMPRLCQPLTATPGQFIQIFLNWAKDNPKQWQEDGKIAMMVAFQETFPCPK